MTPADYTTALVDLARAAAACTLTAAITATAFPPSTWPTLKGRSRSCLNQHRTTTAPPPPSPSAS